MVKKAVVLLTLPAILLTSMTAFAAGVTGKVSQCEGKTITMSVAEAPAWIKKGAPVKVDGVAGTVTEVAGGKVVVKSAKTADCKAGDEVNVVKGVKQSQGC